MSLDGYFDKLGFSEQISAGVVSGPNLVGAEAKFDPPNLSNPFNPIPSQGKMMEFATPNFASPADQYKLLGTQTDNGLVFEPGTVDKLVVSWGRWIGNVDITMSGSTTTVNYTPQGGPHYGGRVVHVQHGRRHSTHGRREHARHLHRNARVGNFTGPPIVGVQGTATVGGLSYTFSTPRFTTTAPITNGMSLAVGPTSNSFGSGASPLATTGTGCVSTCTTAVSGAFYGTNASHAGIVYKVQSIGVTEVTGAATFAK
jgi:hypothetical protein